MLEMANSNTDDLYWEVEPVPQLPKWKRTQLKEELLNNSISTVKMAATQKKKMPKSALKASPSMSMRPALMCKAS